MLRPCKSTISNMVLKTEPSYPREELNGEPGRIELAD